MKTEVLTEERVAATDDGDHDCFAHYAPKNLIIDAMVYGIVITALCGKIWAPTRDGEKFPVCPTCKEIYDSMKDGA